MTIEAQPDPDRELILLEHIEHDPDVTQATLAAQLGVAVGTVNWHLKRLVAKGYVKVKRAQRRKLRYIITPEGIAFRARLTVNYIETSMRLYRRVRERVRELLAEVKQAGYDRILIVTDGDIGEGDIVEICRLTCLEQSISIAEPGPDTYDNPFVPKIPTLEVHGVRVFLRWDPDGMHSRHFTSDERGGQEGSL
jgi:DNA-binding MarR family transcriptional regulator